MLVVNVAHIIREELIKELETLSRFPVMMGAALIASYLKGSILVIAIKMTSL